MSRPSVGSSRPNSPPLKNSRTVSQAPVHAAPEPRASRTATIVSAIRMKRDASGISMPPSWRTGACGAIRCASQVLTSTGTSIAAKPIPNSATCDQSLVVRTLRRPSSSYHITSVMRFTAPPSSPRTMSRTKNPPPMTRYRRHGTSPPATGGKVRPPPLPRPLPSPPVPPLAPLPPVRRRPRRPSSMGVTLRGSPSRGSNGRPSRCASASAWRRWSSSRSLSNQLDICGQCYRLARSGVPRPVGVQARTGLPPREYHVRAENQAGAWMENGGQRLHAIDQARARSSEVDGEGPRADEPVRNQRGSLPRPIGRQAARREDDDIGMCRSHLVPRRGPGASAGVAEERDAARGGHDVGHPVARRVRGVEPLEDQGRNRGPVRHCGPHERQPTMELQRQGYAPLTHAGRIGYVDDAVDDVVQALRLEGDDAGGAADASESSIHVAGRHGAHAAEVLGQHKLGSDLGDRGVVEPVQATGRRMLADPRVDLPWRETVRLSGTDD